MERIFQTVVVLHATDHAEHVVEASQPTALHAQLTISSFLIALRWSAWPYDPMGTTVIQMTKHVAHVILLDLLVLQVMTQAA